MFQLNKATVVRSRATQFAIIMVDELGNDLPTCGLTAIQARILKEDGTWIARDADTSISWGVGGKTFLFTFSFTEAETALFKLGPSLDIGLIVGFGNANVKYKFRKFLTVLDGPFA